MTDPPFLREHDNKWVISDTHTEPELLPVWIEFLKTTTNPSLACPRLAAQLETRTVVARHLAVFTEVEDEVSGADFVNLQYETGADHASAALDNAIETGRAFALFLEQTLCVARVMGGELCVLHPYLDEACLDHSDDMRILREYIKTCHPALFVRAVNTRGVFDEGAAVSVEAVLIMMLLLAAPQPDTLFKKSVTREEILTVETGVVYAGSSVAAHANRSVIAL